MIDYEIKNGDIVISSGDIQVVSGNLSTRQRLEQKLRLWLGEWFLDVNAGFPWLQIIGQRPRPELVRSLITNLLRNDPDVRSVTGVAVSFEGEDRKASVIFTARLGDGQSEQIEVNI